jgi:glyoxylase-like metal-dependent hydrolase (beta-lactamase superfamily II)
MRLGRFSLHFCTDGLFHLDGGAMFGVVPRVLWEKLCPPDEKNRIPMALGCLLIQTDERNILVDTGIGNKGDEKFHRIYGIDRHPPLENSLAQHGLTFNDIDIVINTHLHMDHAGGNTFSWCDSITGVKGHTLPCFPKARYIVQKGEWENATHPNERTRASYIPENFLPLEETNQLELIEEKELEIEEGITLLRTGGHTPFHQCVKIESNDQVALFLADLAPMASHLHLPYIQSYDLHPLETLEAKRRLLKQALEGRWLLIFQHDPQVEAGYLKKIDGKFTLEEAIRL